MKHLLLFILLVYTISTQASNSVLSTKPRLMYNYVLYTDSAFKHDYTKLPDGAKPQLTNDLLSVKKTTLVPFVNKGDHVLRYWYINNTMFTPCKLVLYQNEQLIETILFWPNAESFEIDTKLLKPNKYSIKILDGVTVLEERVFEVGG
jgi:hypothetical protein